MPFNPPRVSLISKTNRTEQRQTRQYMTNTNRESQRMRNTEIQITSKFFIKLFDEIIGNFFRQKYNTLAKNIK